MNAQELQPQIHQEQSFTPIAGSELAGFQPVEVVEAAERMLLQQPSVAEGADAYLQGLETSAQPEVEFDPALLQMFMFLGRMGAAPEAQDLIASALAIDATAKQHGATELTMDYTRKQNAYAAEMAAADRKRLADDEDDTL